MISVKLYNFRHLFQNLYETGWGVLRLSIIISFVNCIQLNEYIVSFVSDYRCCLRLSYPRFISTNVHVYSSNWLYNIQYIIEYKPYQGVSLIFFLIHVIGRNIVNRNIEYLQNADVVSTVTLKQVIFEYNVSACS